MSNEQLFLCKETIKWLKVTKEKHPVYANFCDILIKEWEDKLQELYDNHDGRGQILC